MPNQSWNNGSGRGPFGSKTPRSTSRSSSSSSSSKGANDWGKALKESAKSAIEANARVSDLNRALSSGGSVSKHAAHETAELASSMKLGASAIDQIAGASERGAMSANLQAEALKMLVGLVWDATKAIVALGVAFTKATLDAVDFRQGTAQAIDTITKQKGQGQKAIEIGIELATRFHFDPREAVSSMHELIAKGFSVERSRVLITALADLKVLSPKANLDALTLAIGQIQGKGKLQMEELSGQIAEAGLSVSVVLDQLAAKYGKTNDEIRKMISKGKINAEDGIDAIVAAIAKMGGGKLGSAAEKAARSTVGGLVAGIHTRLGIIPLEMAKTLASSAGVGAVKATLGNLLDALNPSKTPEMKGMIAALAVFANTLFTVLFGGAASKEAGNGIRQLLGSITNGIRMVTAVVATVGPVVMAFAGGFVSGMGDIFEILMTVGQALSEAFGGEAMSAIDVARALGKGLAYLVGVVAVLVAVLATLTAGGAAMLAAMVNPAIGAFAVLSELVLSTVGIFSALPSKVKGAASALGDSLANGADTGTQAVRWAIDKIKALPGELLNAGSSMGTNLWSGFVNGILAGVSAVSEAGNQLASAAKTAVSNTLEIHSPSRVLAELGGHTAQGFVEGVDGGQGQVDAAMNALVSPQAPAGSPAAGGATSGAGGFSFSIGELHVHVGAGSEASGQEIGKSVRTELAGLFEDLLMEAGVAT